MTAQEFETRIVDWARRKSDVKALVLAGSRAGPKAHIDGWSDWDFHLISTHPGRYHGIDWLKEIAPPWCAHAEKTPRGVIKVSAIFQNGLEADFVPVSAWQMKTVYWAMRHPGWFDKMPLRLRNGIVETRVFLLGSGYRVLVGGKDWEHRLSALETPWAAAEMSGIVFKRHTEAFWQKSVWVAKKIARPEPRSAMHWLHRLISDHLYALLAEEALIAGRPSRPEARKAEKWLDTRRLNQTAITTGPDQSVLAGALLAEITLFEEVSRSVAQSRGFELPDYTPVAAWLRTELGRLA